MVVLDRYCITGCKVFYIKKRKRYSYVERT